MYELADKNLCVKVTFKKFIATQLIKIIRSFYEIRRFIFMFTSARHWTVT